MKYGIRIETVSVLATKARKPIISLYKLEYNVGYFDCTELFKLFNTMVKPVLLYGSEILGFEISEAIENVQDQFCIKEVFEVTTEYSTHTR